MRNIYTKDKHLVSISFCLQGVYSAQKYRLAGDDHAVTGGTSYPSPCYSGTSYSADDRAGVKGVGVADEHENVTVNRSHPFLLENLSL